VLYQPERTFTVENSKRGGYGHSFVPIPFSRLREVYYIYSDYMETQYQSEEVSPAQLAWLKDNNILDKDAAALPVRDVHVKKNRKKKKDVAIKEKPADSEIDLHGLGVEEALFKVELELELAKKNKWKSIRIVHGIGEKSGGIIRKILEQKFRSEWSILISEYHHEKNNRGSSLAVLA